MSEPVGTTPLRSHEHPDVGAARRLCGRMPLGWLGAIETLLAEHPKEDLRLILERDRVHRKNIRALVVEAVIGRVEHRGSGNLDGVPERA